MAFEGMEVEDDEEETMSEQLDGIDLLWKGVVKPDEPLVAGGSGKYFLRITNASFGPDVQKDTRTCLTLLQSVDDESEPGVICTLKNNYENHQLDLLISEDVQLRVSGKNPSPIYLIGNLSPAEQHVADDFDMNLDDEPTEEELEEMDSQTRQQLLQQLGRKRRLAEMEEEEPLEEEDEETPTAAKKKQKTASGKGKVTDNQGQGKNKNNKNDNTNDKSANQKKKGNETKEKPKGNTSGKNEEGGDKAWKNGPNGLKYRDIHVGNGKVAKKGSKLKVFYVGQLDDKTVFDKQISGEGFEFVLGGGDVIKGWDLGINGMKVGGKRKLVIPAKLAYGAEGSPPDIPPNSQLTFTVELKHAT